MIEPEKITIVEGPPPMFQVVTDPWVLAMSEGPALPCAGRCLLRTFNSSALVERCQNAWREGRDTYLEYKNSDGLPEAALVLAARATEVEVGQVLHLWLRLSAWPDDFDEDEGPPDMEGDKEIMDDL